MQSNGKKIFEIDTDTLDQILRSMVNMRQLMIENNIHPKDTMFFMPEILKVILIDHLTQKASNVSEHELKDEPCLYYGIEILASGDDLISLCNVKGFRPDQATVKAIPVTQSNLVLSPVFAIENFLEQPSVIKKIR